MARELSSTQQTNVEAGSTRPIYLIEWQHSAATEYLSCSGDITYNGQLYGGGDPDDPPKITGLVDSKTATIQTPATSERVSEIQNNLWRLGICKITAILASPSDGDTFTTADGILVLDGVIERSTFSGEYVTTTVKCKYYTGALVPRFSFNDVVDPPAVGTVSEWEGENYSYEQWLKTVAAIQSLVRPGVNPQVTGRQSVTQINSFESVEDPGQKLLTAEGVKIPIVYGRASVPGYVFAEGEFGGNKFVGVAWCMGEVFSVEKTFINDAVVPSTVTAKHYRGTTTQTVSPALQLYTNTSPQFSDDMILRTPAGDIGICYSVFNIPSGAISGAPRFRAIIQGRLVEDPTSTATDPYFDYIEWSYDFTSGSTDSGPNNYTLTLNGNASVTANGLELDGTGDYATVPDGNEIGSNPFTLELEFYTNTVASSPGSTETLLRKGTNTSPESRCIQIDRVGDEVLLYLSSDGSTWDITDGLSCGTVSGGSPIDVARVVVERVDNQISTYMDGATQTGVVTTLGLFNSSAVWEIGGSTNELNGVVRSARLTIGQYRYGSPHSITNTPYSDSGTYSTGFVYSEKPALCWNDLAKDPVIGMGATTTGVELATEYGDSAMTSGAPRCRIGLAITEPRLVEAWLDQLAMYANCLWFPEGENLKIIPDASKADGINGSGPELYTATSPEFGSPLPTITTEDGVEYSISITIDTASTTSPLGSLTVNFGGSAVMTNITEAKTHGVRVTASGTSNTIEVVSNSFDGTWSNLSVKRTHRSITQFMPSSLTVDGLPEGDKPNSVAATYNVPSTESGAWEQKTFPVLNADAQAGAPIVLTTLSLPGVNRIEEASNKAIATLYRNDSKTRISGISTDEEFVAQPGDTVQFTRTLRGIDTPIWVESNRMIEPGRHQITGLLYRDNQYPNTDYTEPRKFDEAGPATEDVGDQPEPRVYCEYACDALETASGANSATQNQVDTWYDGVSWAWPFATDLTEAETAWSEVPNLATGNVSNNFVGNGSGLGARRGDLSSWSGYAEQPGFCTTPLWVLNLNNYGAINSVFHPPRELLVPGDWAGGCMFTGYNGTSTLSCTIFRNPGYLLILRQGPSQTFVTNAACSIFGSVDSDGSGGHEFNLSGGANKVNSDGFDALTVPLGDLTGKWCHVGWNITNAWEIRDDGVYSSNAYARHTVTCDVQITTQDGLRYNGSITVFEEWQASQDITAIDYHDEDSSSWNFNVWPGYLNRGGSGAISVAHLAFKTGGSNDLTALSRAFESNFSSYTGGDWC